jgi:CheY-like chemotaxis protein
MPAVTPAKTGALSAVVPATLPAVLQGPRVLIVDDNAAILNVMCDYLGSRNFVTVGVESGEEMLRCLGEVEPDILLVDIQMPGMDGLEVIRRVRDYPNPQIAALPVLAVTALAMTGDRERCLDAGANDYISKPVRLEELADAVRRLSHSGAVV